MPYVYIAIYDGDGDDTVLLFEAVFRDKNKLLKEQVYEETVKDLVQRGDVEIRRLKVY